MNETRANTDNLVRRDRCSNSASANRNPSLHISTGNSAGQWHNIIGIVIIDLQMSVSEIDCVMTSDPQFLGEILLQLKTAVVGGNADEFRLDW